jgi:hypothetical protein
MSAGMVFLGSCASHQLTHPAIAVDKFLRGAERGLVGFLDVIEELEGISKFIMH